MLTKGQNTQMLIPAQGGGGGGSAPAATASRTIIKDNNVVCSQETTLLTEGQLTAEGNVTQNLFIYL